MTSRYRICVIRGDGVGQEVVPQAMRVLSTVADRHGFQVEFDEQPWGCDYYLSTGHMMAADAHEVVAAADATLFGAVGSPAVPDSVSAWGLILAIRQQLDLYVNLRPVRQMPIPGRVANRRVDLLIVRENTEGEYIGTGGRMFAGTPREAATQLSVVTRAGTERIAEYAFDAVLPGGLLTSATKSNALPHTMGLWDEVVADVAGRHPDVRWERMHVDAVAYQLVQAPERFDVIVASNLFGDILSDIGAALQGSLGLAASGNVNPQTHVGIFEPVHGSAPDIAALGIANPIGAINSAALLLDFLDEAEAAHDVREAVDKALDSGASTADLGGKCSTTEMGDAVIEQLRHHSRT